MKFALPFIKNRYQIPCSFKKIVSNTSWLVLEKITRLGGGFFISILIARYLGPEQFGIFSYALSIISFLGAFVYLGLSGLVVRDIVRYPKQKELFLGTTFFLKFAGCVFAFIALALIAFHLHDRGGTEFWVLLICGLGLLANPFESIDIWFHSQVQSKFSVYANSCSFLIVSVVKVVLVSNGASIFLIAAASSFESMLTAIFLVFLYRYQGFSILNWTIRFEKAWHLMSRSWILILSGFLALINLRIDQVMLRWISGPGEVGLYSVAANLSEAWYFLPTVIVLSIYPKLIELKQKNSEKFEKNLQFIFDILFIIAFGVALLVSFSADVLILFFYSNSYASSSSILIIHVWAGIFMFMRALFSKWILIEDALYFSLFTHGAGAIVNIVINFVLIPQFGGKGAAFSTLLSYATSSYLCLFFFKKTRPIAVKMSNSLIFPIRLIVLRKNIWS